jgi:hypothetical protein
MSQDSFGKTGRRFESSRSVDVAAQIDVGRGHRLRLKFDWRNIFLIQLILMCIGG